MVVDYLADIFIVLFVILFIYALCALAGWINIDPKHNNKLFTVVIIGLAGGVISLFKNNFLNAQPEYKIITNLEGKNWIAWDINNASIFQPKVKFKVNSAFVDSVTIGESPNTGLKLLKDQALRIGPKNDQYQVKNSKNYSFGFIPKDTLKTDGFFNILKDINLASLSRCKYEKESEGAWTEVSPFNENFPFKVKVEDASVGTIYKIIRKGKTPSEDIEEWSSRNNPSIIDSKSDKPMHFFPHGQNYYMLYISSLDNTGVKVVNGDTFKKRREFNFVQLKLEPDVK